MVDLMLVTLFIIQTLLLLIIALLIGENNRITKQQKAACLEAAWCRAIVDAFVGKVEQERGK